MSAASGAFSAKGGYGQSAAGYYICVGDVSAFVHTNAPATGSGGATTVGQFSTVTLSVGMANLFKSGCIVKDMGKTIVSAGRTFRKIQAVSHQTNAAAALGVVGNASYSPGVDQGYASYYVEVGREGQGGNPAPLARFA